MPQINAIDSILIDATPEHVFDVISDYAAIEDWFPVYRCELLNGTEFIPGLQIKHKMGRSVSFTRRIDGFERGKHINETYLSGVITGTGIWRFEPNDTGQTLTSFDCAVSSNTMLTHIGFILGGNKAHKCVYKKLLTALKNRCETSDKINGNES